MEGDGHDDAVDDDDNPTWTDMCHITVWEVKNLQRASLPHQLTQQLLPFVGMLGSLFISFVCQDVYILTDNWYPIGHDHPKRKYFQGDFCCSLWQSMDYHCSVVRHKAEIWRVWSFLKTARRRAPSTKLRSVSSRETSLAKKLSNWWKVEATSFKIMMQACKSCDVSFDDDDDDYHVIFFIIIIMIMPPDTWVGFKSLKQGRHLGWLKPNRRHLDQQKFCGKR